MAKCGLIKNCELLVVRSTLAYYFQISLIKIKAYVLTSKMLFIPALLWIDDCKTDIIGLVYYMLITLVNVLYWKPQ